MSWGNGAHQKVLHATDLSPDKTIAPPYLTCKVMQLFFVQVDVRLLVCLRFPQDQILKTDDERAVGDYAVFAVLVDGN